MSRRPCFKEVVGFDDRWLMIVGLPLASIFVSLLLTPEAYIERKWRLMSVCLTMSFVYTNAFWWTMRWLYCKIKRRYPSRDQVINRIGWAFLLFHFVFLAVNTIFDWIFSSLNISTSPKPNIIIEYVAALILSALIITIYEAISAYLMLEKAVAEKAILERQNVESQLEGLRNQVNPHFLFNSLNTLVYLIPESPDKAVRFVQKLSKVYRFVLESRDAKIIPLSEEMEFLNAYTYLLKERFGDNLNIHIEDLSTEASSGIVPLSLQMLFENAIKHNIISQEKPLYIDVFTKNDHLYIQNNNQKKNQVSDSTGVGLQNICDRYRMLTDQEIIIEVNDRFFSVALPLIKENLA